MISSDSVVIEIRPLAFYCSAIVDDIQSCLRDWDKSILDRHLQECSKVKSHHVGGDFLLF